MGQALIQSPQPVQRILVSLTPPPGRGDKASNLQAAAHGGLEQARQILAVNLLCKPPRVRIWIAEVAGE